MSIDDGLPKIIEKEDFNKVRQILDARKHRPNSHSLVDYLLTGKIFCGNCGGAFTGSTHYKNGQPYFYYRCCREKSDCKMVSLRKEAVENFVLSEIEKVVHNEKYVSNILDGFVEFYKERNSNSEIIKGLETRFACVVRNPFFRYVFRGCVVQKANFSKLTKKLAHFLSESFYIFH